VLAASFDHDVVGTEQTMSMFFQTLPSSIHNRP
jgi:hypothetical protein